MRVASGDEQTVDCQYDQQTELALTKGTELFSESIPSSVLQTYALLGSDAVSKQAVFSIVCSAMAIAFTSTTISVDYDTDPSKRKLAPNFYGYMPDGNRLLVFGLMMLMSGSHVLMKVLACSLMLRMDRVWFLLYLAGDMFIYISYKFLRADFRYWLNLSGLASLLASIFTRIIAKIIVDFTMILHFRHPYELSELYWSINVFLNQVFCFVSVYLYGKYSKEASDDEVELLWKLVGGLFVFSMLNFGIFLKMINREYIKTFFSPITGKQFAVQNYIEATTDAMKFEIFGHHRSYYDSIQDELMKWLNDNWETWEEEQKDWFTPAAILTVPCDMLPKKALSDMGGVTGRKASIVKMKAEGIGKKKGKGAVVMPS